jgi:hypothetical protein
MVLKRTSSGNLPEAQPYFFFRLGSLPDQGELRIALGVLHFRTVGSCSSERRFSAYCPAEWGLSQETTQRNRSTSPMTSTRASTVRNTDSGMGHRSLCRRIFLHFLVRSPASALQWLDSVGPETATDRSGVGWPTAPSRKFSSCFRPASRSLFLHRKPSFRTTACNWFTIRVRIHPVAIMYGCQPALYWTILAGYDDCRKIPITLIELKITEDELPQETLPDSDLP